MRARRAHQVAWDALGIAIFVVIIFPVFWMISTAFKPEDEVNSLTPTWLSTHPTLQHFRDAMKMPFFWNDVVNTVIVVCVAVAVAMTLAFLAAVALAGHPAELELATLSLIGRFAKVDEGVLADVHGASSGALSRVTLLAKAPRLHREDALISDRPLRRS
jgi:ABC-type glycerol-3-phosphate transport system permease component